MIDASQLFDEPEFLSTIMMPLSWTETDSDKTNLKLEALWILINLSYNDGGDL